MRTAHVIEWICIDERENVKASDLCRACGLSLGDLRELVDYGSLLPLRGEDDEQVFAGSCIAPLRELSRLRVDLDLDQFTMALVLGYLNRISVLEERLQVLQEQVPALGNEAHRHVQ
jgi:chaperone modulatory protein CbpM